MFSETIYFASFCLFFFLSLFNSSKRNNYFPEQCLWILYFSFEAALEKEPFYKPISFQQPSILEAWFQSAETNPEVCICVKVLLSTAKYWSCTCSNSFFRTNLLQVLSYHISLNRDCLLNNTYSCSCPLFGNQTILTLYANNTCPLFSNYIHSITMDQLIIDHVHAPTHITEFNIKHGKMYRRASKQIWDAAFKPSGAEQCWQI